VPPARPEAGRGVAGREDAGEGKSLIFYFFFGEIEEDPSGGEKINFWGYL
jgi:hypothetical protein